MCVCARKPSQYTEREREREAFGNFDLQLDPLQNRYIWLCGAIERGLIIPQSLSLSVLLIIPPLYAHTNPITTRETNYLAYKPQFIYFLFKYVILNKNKIFINNEWNKSNKYFKNIPMTTPDPHILYILCVPSSSALQWNWRNPFNRTTVLLYFTVECIYISSGSLYIYIHIGGTWQWTQGKFNQNRTDFVQAQPNARRITLLQRQIQVDNGGRIILYKGEYCKWFLSLCHCGA